MKIFDFEKYFPNEATCKAKFREVKEKQGYCLPQVRLQASLLESIQRNVSVCKMWT